MHTTQILANSSSARSAISTDASEASPQKLYVKVVNFPGLYRHAKRGRYYGVKKVRAKRKEHSLDTSDRKIAERRYKEWVANLERWTTRSKKPSSVSSSQRFRRFAAAWMATRS